MKTILKVYDSYKHKNGCKEIARIKMNVDHFRIVCNDGFDDDIVSEIEKDGLFDDDHEYLMLYLDNGDISVYRNNFCDLMQVGVDAADRWEEGEIE